MEQQKTDPGCEFETMLGQNGVYCHIVLKLCAIIVWFWEQSCFLSCIEFDNVPQLVLVLPQMSLQVFCPISPV